MANDDQGRLRNTLASRSTKGRLADVCDRYRVAKLEIFCSQTRGTAGPDSDIDVLCTLRPGYRLGWEIEQFADELTGFRHWRTNPPVTEADQGSALGFVLE